MQNPPPQLRGRFFYGLAGVGAPPYLMSIGLLTDTYWVNRTNILKQKTCWRKSFLLFGSILFRKSLL